MLLPKDIDRLIASPLKQYTRVVVSHQKTFGELMEYKSALSTFASQSQALEDKVKPIVVMIETYCTVSQEISRIATTILLACASSSSEEDIMTNTHLLDEFQRISTESIQRSEKLIIDVHECVGELNTASDEDIRGWLAVSENGASRAVEVIKNVEGRLQGGTHGTVSEHVHKLLGEALSLDNWAVMFEGWGAWI